jgi:beta-xylosidase
MHLEAIARRQSIAPPAGTFPWSPDNQNGTYSNPILFADYSDPDVIRVGDDFYLTASSFNCTPGLPILHSQDLVNWRIIAHAVKNLPHPRYAEVQRGCGIWAPALRFHDGRFWIFFPMPDEGIYQTTAPRPTGPWSPPHLVEAGKGLIDPCPFWDDDGAAYLAHAYANSRSGLKDMLRVRPMAPDGARLLGEGKIVFHNARRHPTIEGPKFLKKDGWYYLFAPAGGVAKGWQVALRSRSIYGPYEDQVVLEQGATCINGPHQGALVDLPNGDWWFIHFQDAGVYGRIVHLQPVSWKDGWPYIGEDRDGNGIGEPVLQYPSPAVNARPGIAVPQTSDEFDAPEPGRQWQWQANHDDGWFSLSERPGWLRLRTQCVPAAALERAPNLLLQKFPARSFEVETLLSFNPELPGDEAGLVITGRTSAALAVRHNGADRVVVFRENGADRIIGITAAGEVKLRVKVEAGGICRFAHFTNEGHWQPLPNTFQASAGDWIGAKVGIYSLTPNPIARGHADFDYFRFAP